MLPEPPRKWHDSFDSNETLYLAELLVEMNAFFSKADNLTNSFDIQHAKANSGKNVNFGFVFEAAIELGLIKNQFGLVSLTLDGYQTASVGDIEEISKIISILIILSKTSDIDLSPETPY